MFCKNCGKEIANDAAFCPYCGTKIKCENSYSNTINASPYTYTPQPAPKDTSNTIAIVGFVLSFFFCLAGLICSIIGYKKAKEEGFDNKGLAIAGIVISAIELAVVVLYIFIFVITIGIIIGGAGALYI